MIVEFSIANFRSFKTLQTLSFEAANISSKDKNIDGDNVAVISKKLKILKSKAIYGANASGKSNLIKAISVFLKLIRFSVKTENLISQLVKRFELSTETEDEPTFFQLIFFYESTIYRYGFEVKEGKIITEWLFGNPKGVEVPFFTRETRNVQVNERSFKAAKKHESLLLNEENEIFRDDSLFLSAVSAMGESFAKSIVNEMLSINLISSVNDPLLKEIIKAEMISSQDKQENSMILELLRSVDDIEDVQIAEKDNLPDEMPDELKQLIKDGEWNIAPDFHSIRTVYDAKKNKFNTVSGDFEDWESEGTKKFFYLSPLLINALKQGRTLIIDEFDARLHPLLTKKIVGLFNSQLTNPHAAQLLFVTHDTNFLKANLLRRDQICFVEKDRFGSSTLKTLVEFKGVRNDASFDKEYLQGKYGAVRFLNTLENTLIL